MPSTGKTEPNGTRNGRVASGRLSAQDQDRGAHHDEREQRADAGHLADDLNRHEGRRRVATMTQVMIVVM